MLRCLSLWAWLGCCVPAWALAQTPPDEASSSQPEWTRARFFQGGQIYVIPPRSVRVEYNLQDALTLDGTGITTVQSRIGAWATLPMRWQIGVLAQSAQAKLIAPLVLTRETVTLDWAWAPWGRLWGNPVISAGFMRGTNVAPEGSLRVTVGGAVWERWRCYAALQFGRELAGFALRHMYQLRAGLAWQSNVYPITWSVDAGFGLQDQIGSRFRAAEYDLWVTPGFAWEPWGQLYLMAVVGAMLTSDRDNGTSTSSWTATPEAFIGYHLD